MPLTNRPDFDLERYAERWKMDRKAAEELVRRHRAEPFSTGSRCELARAYFLMRDLANAAYHWLSAERTGGSCPEPDEVDGIASWLGEQAESEEWAAAGRPPQRVLIVTGMGHKYFIDTLVFQSRYRWVDPREYLPES